MKSNSWIIRNKETKKVVFETFSKHVVDCLNTTKYEAVDSYTYLCELNAKIKEDVKTK